MRLDELCDFSFAGRVDSSLIPKEWVLEKERKGKSILLR